MCVVNAEADTSKNLYVLDIDEKCLISCCALLYGDLTRVKRTERFADLRAAAAAVACRCSARCVVVVVVVGSAGGSGVPEGCIATTASVRTIFACIEAVWRGGVVLVVVVAIGYDG